MRNETMGRLLPFAQSAQALRRFAGKQRAQGNDLQAAELLRMSLSRDAGDAETALSLAEAYASLECYDLSNRILISLMDDGEYTLECLYGTGMNMLALGMNECARDCFIMYLGRDPGGEHAMEIVEALEGIEAEQEETSGPELRLEKRVQRALDALEKDRAALAVRLLQRALSLDDGNSGVYALRAFARLAMEDVRGALADARHALMLCRDDLRALCATAAALHETGAKNNARAFLERAAALAQEENEAMLVCHTACETDAPDVVIRLLSKTEEASPCCSDLLHLMACAHYNAGNPQEAVRRFKLLRRIDPGDAAAEYWLKAVEAGETPERIPYQRRAPMEEMLRRLRLLRGYLQQGPQALADAMDAEDSELFALLAWAVSCGEEGVARMAVSILALLKGTRSQTLLKRVLSDAEASRALKNEALAALCMQGQTGPFHAVTDGRLTVVHVSNVREGRTARQEEMFEQVMIRRLGAATQRDAARVRALCRASLRETGVGARVRMKTIALAWAALSGKEMPASAARRERRAARRLAREALSDGMYQL